MAILTSPKSTCLNAPPLSGEQFYYRIIWDELGFVAMLGKSTFSRV